MIGLLLALGAVQVSLADESPALAAVMVGAPGTAYGTTAVDAGLVALVPIELTAATVNV
ncbi:hypothetical protein NKG94_01485 [Micromonospora sp. M12]